VKRFLVSVVVILVALAASGAAWLLATEAPRPFPEGSVSAARLAPGPRDVAVYRDTFVDDSRTTQAHGDYAGSPQRRLPATVWYPAGVAVPGPLIVFSHGFTSLRGNGRYLGEHLASHGYVVAAVDYPLTSAWAPGGAYVEDVVQQPGDISFLIDALERLARREGHDLAGRIDTTRIGAFGISLGGLTSTLAGFHPDLRDARIGAVLSIAGPTNFFTATFFRHADIPFLVLAGNLDALVPWEANAEPVPRKAPGARLVTVLGGSHTGFSHGSAWLRMMKNTDALGCWSVTRFIDAGDSSDWEGLLGTPSQGLDYSAPNELCRVDPLPETINVLRQQMIARVVVRAFFDSVFDSSADRRREASRYLDTILAQELDDVSVAGTPPPVGGSAAAPAVPHGREAVNGRW
jgi:predicted dienelactone hydrolase